jgi:hypothetical protein
LETRKSKIPAVCLCNRQSAIRNRQSGILNRRTIRNPLSPQSKIENLKSKIGSVGNPQSSIENPFSGWPRLVLFQPCALSGVQEPTVNPKRGLTVATAAPAQFTIHNSPFPPYFLPRPVPGASRGGLPIRYCRLCLLQSKIENLKSKIGSIGNRKSKMG